MVSRSCDFTPLESFLCSYLKSQAYKNNSQTICELKDEIIGAIGEVEQQLIQILLKIITRGENL